MSRQAGAAESIREAIAAATGVRPALIGLDDDMIDDLKMDELERESLGLVIEEIFGVRIPPDLWRSALYRTANALSEWVVREAERQAWLESQRQSRRG